jgi:hypothetical protein
MRIPATIAVEAEVADDSTTMFRIRVNGKLAGESLTAVQAHLIVGNFLERIALPRRSGKISRELDASVGALA